MNDSDLTAGIDRAGDFAQVGAACRRAALALGFPHFLYGFRVPLAQPRQLILSGYPAQWRAHYDQQRYLAIDPVMRRALSSVLPFAWDELDRSDAAVARMFDGASAHGLRHGLSAPVHGAHGERGVMSLAGKQALPAAGAERLKLFQRVQWFAAVAHARLRSLVSRDDASKTSGTLSARERECLQLAAQGKPARDIGREMNLSERTVVFHLNRAQEKLGATRRQEAVARAMALGEISPPFYPDRFSESETLIECPD